MPFLPPNQQRQSTEGCMYVCMYQIGHYFLTQHQVKMQAPQFHFRHLGGLPAQVIQDLDAL